MAIAEDRELVRVSVSEPMQGFAPNAPSGAWVCQCPAKHQVFPLTGPGGAEMWKRRRSIGRWRRVCPAFATLVAYRAHRSNEIALEA